VTENPSDFSKAHQLNVRPALFETQLDFITKHFTIISPGELTTNDYPTPAALITFDDGLRSYFHTAVPILQKRNIPSIIFLNMEPVEGKLFWSGLVTYLSEFDKEFQEYIHSVVEVKDNEPLFLQCSRRTVDEYLQNHPQKEILIGKARKYYGGFATYEDIMKGAMNPLVYFGNHLYNHYNVLMMTDFELQETFFLNKEKLSDFPNTLPFFSYTFGCFESQHTEKIFRMGAKAVFGSNGGINTKKGKQFYDRIGITERIKTMDDLATTVVKRNVKHLLKNLADGRRLRI